MIRSTIALAMFLAPSLLPGRAHAQAQVQVGVEVGAPPPPPPPAPVVAESVV